jgi:hypothetical protein
MTDDLIELRGLRAHLKVILSLDSWNGVFLVLKIDQIHQSLYQSKK